MDKVNYELIGKIAVVTLRNPPQNRLDWGVVQDMEKIIPLVETSGAHVMILKAEGPDFSYGGYFPDWIGQERHQVRLRNTRSLAILNRFERMPIPIIACVQGACWGGGFEYALACDMIIATPDANFNHPEKTLAITTLLGGVYRFAERAGRNVAAELAFTSTPIPAQRMYELGVVNHIIEKDKINDYVMKLAQDIADGPVNANAAHKTLLRIWSKSGRAAADEALQDLSMSLFGSEDVDMALDSAQDALEKGIPRPILKFNGSSNFN